MAVETIGKYQLHLFADQLSSGQWSPYLTILEFDDAKADFLLVMNQHRVAGDRVFPSYEEAIEQARRAGNAWIEIGQA